MKYDCHLFTSQGGREENEDCADCRFSGDMGLLAIADGLGGHRDGQVASRCCVETLMERFGAGEPESDFAEANRRVRRLGGPLSTLSVAYLNGEKVVFATSGDTRAYLFRDCRVVFQSIDDSVPQMLVSLGELTQEQVRTSPDRSRLLSVVGADAQLKVRVSEGIALQAGDAILLCTDGAWELIHETEMLLDLAQSAHSRDWCERLALRLAQKQSAHGDNATLLCCIAEEV